MRPVPVTDPGAVFRGARDELIRAFEDVLDGGRYILGERVQSFEAAWAAGCASRHAIGVSSGTDALALALRAAGVESGDEVLVPAMTAVATWAAVTQIGAVPVGVDIEEVASGMDAGLARAAVTAKTRALVVVHLHGRPAEVAALADVAGEASIPMIEDAAQAHGASVAGQPVGSLGAAAAFSFYPTKNLGAIGDAGAVTTSSDELAEQVRLLREYGWRTRADAEIQGVNARLDELQAAFLLVMLPRLQEANARRRRIAQAYTESLVEAPGLELPLERPGSESVWHVFAVRHERREALTEALAARGVGTARHYATLPSHNTAFRHLPSAPFPVAERHASRTLSLPIHGAMGEDDTATVIDAVLAACAEV
jgi:dTDP-3-amino-3,4,6-trideoxy-alpha-D-glucose transaminase